MVTPQSSAAQPPARLVAVELVLDNGNRVVYPCSPPRRLAGPPRAIELISGKAYLRDA